MTTIPPIELKVPISRSSSCIKATVIKRYITGITRAMIAAFLLPLRIPYPRKLYITAIATDNNKRLVIVGPIVLPSFINRKAGAKESMRNMATQVQIAIDTIDKYLILFSITPQ